MASRASLALWKLILACVLADASADAAWSTPEAAEMLHASCAPDAELHSEQRSCSRHAALVQMQAMKTRLDTVEPPAESVLETNHTPTRRNESGQTEQGSAIALSSPPPVEEASPSNVKLVGKPEHGLLGNSSAETKLAVVRAEGNAPVEVGVGPGIGGIGTAGASAPLASNVTASSGPAAAAASASVLPGDETAGIAPLTPEEDTAKSEDSVTPIPGREMHADGGEVLPPQSQDSDSGPRESDVDTEGLGGGLSSIGKYLRGKPQVLYIFIMMLLPAGICAVMYLVFHIIRIMEDGPAQSWQEDDSGGSRRQTLGEMVQPDNHLKRPYEPLCPELVAPTSNESLIALPSLQDCSPGSSQCERLIVNKKGAPIVRVVLTRMADSVPEGGAGGSFGAPGQILERISLIAAQRQNALGFCELQVPQSSSSGAQRQLKCCIYRPTGDLFAAVEEEPVGMVSSLLKTDSTAMPGARTYRVMTAATGLRMWIQGSIANRNLTVKELDKEEPVIRVDAGEELEFKTEANDYYRIRVQPKADAGVIIMALLAIDRLPGSHNTF